MGYKLAYLLVIILLVNSCKIENTNTINSSLSPIWEKDFQVGLTTCINPVLTGEYIIFSSYERENKDLQAPSRLLGYKKEGGDLIWEWKNRETNKSDDLLSAIPVYSIYNNLYFSVGPRCYAINANNGETTWFKSYGNFASTYLIKYSEEIYYLIGADNSFKRTLINVNLQTGDSTSVLEFISSDSITISGHEFIIEDNIIYFIKGKRIELSNQTVFDVSLVKYDKAVKKILYDIPMESLSLNEGIEYLKKYDDNTLLAIANKQMVSIDEATGNLNWSLRLPSNQFHSQILTTDAGLLYVVTEENLMCVNIASGNVLWDVVPEHLGLNSRILLHKGVLYFVSGGRFNAFEAENGQQLMSLIAPSVKWSGVSDNFQGAISLDAENDRIYIASYTAAYCYPTLR